MFYIYKLYIDIYIYPQTRVSSCSGHILFNIECSITLKEKAIYIHTCSPIVLYITIVSSKTFS